VDTWGAPSHAGGWTVPGYTELEETGSGPVGRVVTAVHDRSGRRVAVRYLSPGLVADPGFMRRFRADARLLTELTAPQVVRVHAFAEQPGEGAAVVTELVSGVSLATVVRQHGPLSPRAALAAAKSVLLALAAGHTLRIAHRDCQPGNVLVDPAGDAKLSDFGLAVPWRASLPGEGTPAYLAPERWLGAAAGPASDIYAAAALLFECLAGHTPFTGALSRLPDLHAVAPVPVGRIDPPLRDLVLRGLAKEPQRRPRSASAFVSELESAARAGYGPGWERTGRQELAGRARAAAAAAAVAVEGTGPVSRPVSSSTASRFRAAGRGRRLLGIVAAAVAAVAVIGGVAAAVTMQPGHGAGSGNGSGSPRLVAVAPSYTAAANVTPPVSAGTCARPAAFSFSGTLSATTAGTVTYRWVYSSGKPGPETTVRFSGPGHQAVTGQTVAARSAGTGWAELTVLSPVPRTSNKAAYRRLCGGSSAGGISVTAAVTPSARTASCAPAPPGFTAAGSIRAAKAERVTYYWARSDGQASAPATLTFSQAGTLAVTPLTIAPPAASGAGEAVLVVTSPVTVASAPAAYTLTCKAPAAAPGGTPGAPAASATATPAASASGSPGEPAASSGPSGSASPTAPAPTSPTSPASPTSPSPAGPTTPGSSSGHLAIDSSRMALDAAEGSPYSSTVTAAGGTGPYSWSVPGLPPGLTASPDGASLTISGVPTVAGPFNFTMSVSDSSSPALTATHVVLFYVSLPPLRITVNAPATATIGQPYSATVTATGGDGNYSWQTTRNAQGLTVTAQGATLTISGSPVVGGVGTEVGGTVNDGESPAQIENWVITTTFIAAPSTISGSTPAATVGQPYTATLTASGSAAHRRHPARTRSG
jgi:eukaryotic-like serine/threonine-protein kinase